MKKIISTLICLILVAGLASCGTQSEDSVKIGIMQFGEFAALQNACNGFIEGLAQAGIRDGENNVKIIVLSAAADTGNCPAIADRLINEGCDLIFAIATPSVLCVKEKTSDIPVLFTAVTDPVASGIISDAKNPGCNISGTSDMNPVEAQMEFIREMLPSVKTVAVLYTSSESNSKVQFDMAKKKLAEMGINCVEKTISEISEAKSAVEGLAARKDVDAIYIPTDNTLADGMAAVSMAAEEAGIPIFAGEPGMVVNGATASYGVDYIELGRQSAAMAVKILGSDDPLAAISSMPVEYQTKECETALNKKGVEALKLQIPASVTERAVFY